MKSSFQEKIRYPLFIGFNVLIFLYILSLLVLSVYNLFFESFLLLRPLFKINSFLEYFKEYWFRFGGLIIIPTLYVIILLILKYAIKIKANYNLLITLVWIPFIISNIIFIFLNLYYTK